MLFSSSACTAVAGNADGTGPASSGGNAPGGGAPSAIPGGGDTSSGASGGASAAVCNADASLAPARVWRITDDEYINVVRQTFGVTMPQEITQPRVIGADYTNLSELVSVDLNIAKAYQAAAHQAAQQAVTSHLPTFLPCGTQAPTDACVEQFIRNRVSRAFSRPVTDEEVQGLLAVYHSSGTEGAGSGVRLIIEATLQSPSFLYRTELGVPQAGGPTAKTTLTAYEIASALSFATLDSAPDDALWDKAEDGSITQPDVLTGQVERLLAMPAVQQNLSHNAGYWLGVERLAGTEKQVAPTADVPVPAFPEFTAQVKMDLYNSAKLFVQDVFTNGTVTDLLTSKRMYLNESLAKLYNIPGVTSKDLTPVDVALPERSLGILSQPGILAAYSRPNRGDVVHRGLYLYYSFACGRAIPPPPDGALAIAASLPATNTERDNANYRAANSCRACHANFDPLGLTTERYDGIGRYTDATDASSTVVNLDELNGQVSGLPDLVSRLKTGRRVPDCAVTNLTQFVLGLQVADTTAGVGASCALKTVKDKFAASGSFKDFYRALLTSPGFITRDPAAQ